jgi:hypothetical protein
MGVCGAPCRSQVCWRYANVALLVTCCMCVLLSDPVFKSEGSRTLVGTAILDMPAAGLDPLLVRSYSRMHMLIASMLKCVQPLFCRRATYLAAFVSGSVRSPKRRHALSSPPFAAWLHQGLLPPRYCGRLLHRVFERRLCGMFVCSVLLVLCISVPLMRPHLGSVVPMPMRRSMWPRLSFFTSLSCSPSFLPSLG